MLKSKTLDCKIQKATVQSGTSRRLHKPHLFSMRLHNNMRNGPYPPSQNNTKSATVHQYKIDWIQQSARLQQAVFTKTLLQSIPQILQNSKSYP